MPRWATATDRASFTTDDVTRLLLVVHDKIQETVVVDEDEVILEQRAVWENIGAQIESLLRYHVCCACLALVHEEDRERHPCGPCTCTQPVVKSVEHPHEDDVTPPQDTLLCSWPAGVTGGGRLIPCRKAWGHEGRCEPVE